MRLDKNRNGSNAKKQFNGKCTEDRQCDFMVDDELRDGVTGSGPGRLAIYRSFG